MQNPSVAKIVAIAFDPKSRVRLKTTVVGDPPGYFNHSQNYTTYDSLFSLCKQIVDIELKQDPGLPLDLILVNSDVGFKEGNEFIKTFDGVKLQRGEIKVLTRPSQGMAYGSYNDAYMKYRDKYDYFIFTEDDIIPNGKNYALKGVEQFNVNPNIGFLAYQGISYVSDDGVRSHSTIHAHGGCGMAKSSVLNQVVEKYGSLPFSRDNQGKSTKGYKDIIFSGELAFTNVFLQLGYELAEIPREFKLYDYAYDLERGIKVPRYPSYPRVLLIYIVRLIKRIKRNFTGLFSN